jgi:hypothetical protein
MPAQDTGDYVLKLLSQPQERSMDTHAETQEVRPRVTLEGTYTPANYLEEPMELEGTDYTATIADGRIEVAFREPEPLPDADRQAAVSRKVEQVFNTHMILTGRSAAVTGLTMKRRYPDGRADIWVSVSSGFYLFSGCSADFLITDADGNVVRDTKAERLADIKAFRDQGLRHVADPLLGEMMASFRQAIADPDDQMTHLYEIRDALKRHFGGEKKAQQALGLTSSEWTDFGRITNSEPIKQSRHRGSHPVLRPATEQERARVIDVARRMIRAYLDHLDRPPTP